MSMLHELKTWPRHFEAIWDGRKTFEFRFNDRNYQVGDLLYLREWQPHMYHPEVKQGEYTGRFVMAVVTYVLRETEELPECVPDMHVIMSIRKLYRGEPAQYGTDTTRILNAITT